eukprot:scaffold59837_cov33-Phaeocystis_antarctica.AAC.1
MCAPSAHLVHPRMAGDRAGKGESAEDRTGDDGQAGEPRRCQKKAAAGRAGRRRRREGQYR